MAFRINVPSGGTSALGLIDSLQKLKSEKEAIDKKYGLAQEKIDEISKIIFDGCETIAEQLTEEITNSIKQDHLDLSTPEMCDELADLTTIKYAKQIIENPSSPLESHEGPQLVEIVRRCLASKLRKNQGFEPPPYTEEDKKFVQDLAKLVYKKSSVDAERDLLNQSIQRLASRHSGKLHELLNNDTVWEGDKSPKPKTYADCIEQAEILISEIKANEECRVQISKYLDVLEKNGVTDKIDDVEEKYYLELRKSILNKLLSKHGIQPPKDTVDKLLEVGRSLIFAPPTTANNTEVNLMSAAEWQYYVKAIGMEHVRDLNVEESTVLTRVSRKLIDSNIAHLEEGASISDIAIPDKLLIFMELWRKSAYARLEVSHKLAAAFCLTDAHDSEDIQAPWEAWSLIIPDGLLGTEAARLWCIGKKIVFGVTKDGDFGPWSEAERFVPKTSRALYENLVLTACVALVDRSHVTRQGRWGAPAPPKHRRSGPPPDGSRYVLSAPVKIDLRETLTEVLTGKSKGGGAPKVQFLVRGHARMQAHGPKHSLRKPIWVEPFWKGPEEARVLLRTHKVEDK